MKLPAREQAGLGLVELMVATVLALLVLAGVATVHAGLKGAWQSQDELAGMQDSERMAIVLLSQVLRHAGFSPDPVGLPPALALPADDSAVGTGFGALAAGQGLMGTSAGGAAADTLTVRFLADGDGVVRDCAGNGSYARGTLVTSRIALDPAGNLACAVNGAPAQPLVDGIAGLAVSYGVDTQEGCSPCQPRRYMTADQVSVATAWGRVRSVRLVVRFRVPRGSPPWVEWAQNVAVMNP